MRWLVKQVDVNLGPVKGTIELNESEREAAWELYVELETRAATQPLRGEGSEERAVESLSELFGITREILKRHGARSGGTGQIALDVLNEVIRPVTTRWHKPGGWGGTGEEERKAFRTELEATQEILRAYGRQLLKVARG